MSEEQSKADIDHQEDVHQYKTPDGEEKQAGADTSDQQDYDRYHEQWTDDDRAPEARGRDSGSLAKSYWL